MGRSIIWEQRIPLFHWLKNCCRVAGNACFHFKVLTANCKMQWNGVLANATNELEILCGKLLPTPLTVSGGPYLINQVRKVKHKKSVDFTRASHCSSCDLRVTRNIWNCRTIFTLPRKRWTVLNMYVETRVAKRSVQQKNCSNSIFEPHNTIHMRQIRPLLKTTSLKIKKQRRK